MNVTVIADETRSATGECSEGRLLVAPGALEAATGWHLDERGLCRGDQCVPVANSEDLMVDGKIDLEAVGRALRRPTAVDVDHGIVAMADPASTRAAELRSLAAPGFTLPDLDGNPVSLADFSGKKKLLVAWASW